MDIGWMELPASIIVAYTDRQRQRVTRVECVEPNNRLNVYIAARVDMWTWLGFRWGMQSSTILTADDARQYIGKLARNIGLGFHPDTQAADYVNINTDARLFTDRAAHRMDANIDRCRQLLGDSIYDVAMDAWREAGYVPTTD